MSLLSDAVNVKYALKIRIFITPCLWLVSFIFQWGDALLHLKGHKNGGKVIIINGAVLVTTKE